jgi:hypothetical protein
MVRAKMLFLLDLLPADFRLRYSTCFPACGSLLVVYRIFTPDRRMTCIIDGILNHLASVVSYVMVSGHKILDAK